MGIIRTHWKALLLYWHTHTMVLNGEKKSEKTTLKQNLPSNRNVWIEYTLDREKEVIFLESASRVAGGSNRSESKKKWNILRPIKNRI